MRVQSKKWFRRNRHKSPKLVKVLRFINRKFPNTAHLLEVDLDDLTVWSSTELVCWYDIVFNTIIG